ncbi:MAG: hypothetical protein JXQ73_15225 [Phycisphaerae bacterium]|nr:hypothetical protein [Phycisphaerae bacterium]
MAILQLLLTICAALLLVGLALLYFGLWPRRRGETPHCGRCDYNLTGVESDRCPECGTPVSDQTIVRGDRRRRRGLVATGMILSILALGVGGLVGLGMARRVDWYRYRPTAWVIDDLESGSTPTVRRAWQEIGTRLRRSEFGPSHRPDLIETCLRLQVKPPPDWTVRQETIEFLAQCYIDGVLAKAQADTFLRQIAHVAFRARRVTDHGCEIPAVWIYQGQGPRQGRLKEDMWILFESPSVLLGGKPLDYRGFSPKLAQYVSTANRFNMKAKLPWQEAPPGQYDLSLGFTLKVFLGPFGKEDESRLCYEQKMMTLTQLVDLRAADQPSAITLVDDPGIGQKLRDCLRLRARYYQRPGRPGQYLHTLIVETKPRTRLPVSVAARVFVRFDGKEYPAGVLAEGTDRPFRYAGPPWDYDGPAPKSFDVILRPDQALARESIDVYAMWGGEMVFKDIPTEAGSPRREPLAGP